MCAPPPSGGPGRAGGVPAGGEGGPARPQGEAASRLRSVSGSTAGAQGPLAAHHAEGESGGGGVMRRRTFMLNAKRLGSLFY